MVNDDQIRHIEHDRPWSLMVSQGLNYHELTMTINMTMVKPWLSITGKWLSSVPLRHDDDQIMVDHHQIMVDHV